MSDILRLTTAQLRDGYRSGELSPADAVMATLEHLEGVNPLINAVPFVVDEQRLRADADASAARWAAGSPLSSLDGVPVTIKDSLRAVGMPWRHGLAPNAQLPMSDADATPVQRLKEAGAIIVGKTAMPDFGLYGAGVSSLYGIVRNPWDLATNPGGSSAGAGAALAAGVGWAAIGTDIAGSVRIPAAYCGLVALKPTQGRIPYLPSSNVRSAGPMARTVAEAQELYEIISRFDPRDTYGLPPEQPLEKPFDPTGLRIGVLRDVGYGFAASDAVLAVLDEAAALVASHGATVEEIAPPFDTDPYDALDVLFQVRGMTEWEAFTQEQQALIHPDAAAWIRAGSGLTATDYDRALNEVFQSQLRFAAAHRGYDLVLAPTRPVSALPAESVGLDPRRPLADTGFTCWYNQTGQPAASICFGFESGHPIGLQLAGARFTDRFVLSAAAWFEAHRGLEMDWPYTPRELVGASPTQDTGAWR